jgi:uncharacterized protein (DUF1778 family)
MKKRLQSIHVRLRPEQIRFINELANELGENFSDVLRNLVDIAVLVLNVADKITLRDLLMEVDYDKYLRRGEGNSGGSNPDEEG